MERGHRARVMCGGKQNSRARAATADGKSGQYSRRGDKGQVTPRMFDKATGIMPSYISLILHTSHRCVRVYT